MRLKQFLIEFGRDGSDDVNDNWTYSDQIYSFLAGCVFREGNPQLELFCNH
jgi:hypothetical protein